MRKFVVKVSSFISVFILLFFLMVEANFIMMRSADIPISKNKNILVLGDSNTQTAINDSIFENAKNLSSHADSYFYSYLKLKKVLRSGQKVDTLLLSFSPHNIFENGWLLNDEHVYSRFRKYYPLMNQEELGLLLSENPRAVMNGSSQILKQFPINISNSLMKKDPFDIGGFVSLERNILDEVLQKLRKEEPLPFFKIPEEKRPSEYELTYLSKIIELSAKNRIKLYLINVPKRTELLTYKKYGVKEFNEVYDKRFKQIEYLDFSEVKLPDSGFGDLVHLNKEGSTIFSKFLNEHGLADLSLTYGKGGDTDDNLAEGR